MANKYWMFVAVKDVQRLFREHGYCMFLRELEQAEAKLQKQPKPGRVINADWILEIAV